MRYNIASRHFTVGKPRAEDILSRSVEKKAAIKAAGTNSKIAETKQGIVAKEEENPLLTQRQSIFSIKNIGDSFIEEQQEEDTEANVFRKRRGSIFGNDSGTIFGN